MSDAGGGRPQPERAAAHIEPSSFFRPVSSVVAAAAFARCRCTAPSRALEGIPSVQRGITFGRGAAAPLSCLAC